MEHWTYIERNVAQAFALEPQLQRVLGGYELKLGVKLHTLGWPGWEQEPMVGLQVMPTVAEVKVSAGSPARTAILGQFSTVPNGGFQIMRHPADAHITYVGQLSSVAIYGLEELRRGDVLHIEARMVADGYIGGHYVGSDAPATFES